MTLFAGVVHFLCGPTSAGSIKRPIPVQVIIIDMQTQPLLILVPTVNVCIVQIYFAVSIGKAPGASVSFCPVPFDSIRCLPFAIGPIAPACCTVWPPVWLRFILRVVAWVWKNFIVTLKYLYSSSKRAISTKFSFSLALYHSYWHTVNVESF